jgi:hypothetical protein
MELRHHKIVELRGKILKGIELAFEKLVEAKKKTNGEFVFSKDGKIYFAKAMDLKECHESK